MATKSFGDPIDRMTAYCTYCPKMCRFSCPAAQAEGRETVTPWGMMRLFELVKDGAVEPSQEVADTFYHCMGCLRCQTYCRHENDVPHAMWEARDWMGELGFVPEGLQGFGERFLAHNGPHAHLPALDIPEGIFDPNASVAFFPDCETRQHYPALVARAGRLLTKFNGAPVRLVTRLPDPTSGEAEGYGCCGFSLLSAGRKDDYRAYREQLEAALEGVEQVVTDCAAMAALHREGTSWGYRSGLEVVHLIEFLADNLDFVTPARKIALDDFKLFDSCFVGRHLELYEATRRLARALCDEEPEEFYSNRADAPCCGGPSHYHVIAPAASEQCAQDILEQMDLEGGRGILCGSATCKKAFRRAGDERVALDILELACQAFDL